MKGRLTGTGKTGVKAPSTKKTPTKKASAGKKIKAGFKEMANSGAIAKAGSSMSKKASTPAARASQVSGRSMGGANKGYQEKAKSLGTTKGLAKKPTRSRMATRADRGRSK